MLLIAHHLENSAVLPEAKRKNKWQKMERNEKKHSKQSHTTEPEPQHRTKARLLL